MNHLFRRFSRLLLSSLSKKTTSLFPWNAECTCKWETQFKILFSIFFFIEIAKKWMVSEIFLLKFYCLKIRSKSAAYNDCDASYIVGFSFLCF